MWVDYKIASNLFLAQIWKDLFESEGLPTRLIPENGINEWREDMRKMTTIAGG